MRWTPFPLALLLLACAGAPDATAPGALDVVDLDGKHHAVFVPGPMVTVLLFVTVDCPIANSYAPQIAALVRDHGALPVRFLLVHVDPSVGGERVREHARQFDLPGPIVLDPTHALTRRAGATVTPEAVVLDRAGQLVYRGRIDDAWAELGRRRTAPRTQDLRDAVAAALSGQPVPTPWPPAVGCVIQQP